LGVGGCLVLFGGFVVRVVSLIEAGGTHFAIRCGGGVVGWLSGCFGWQPGGVSVVCMGGGGCIYVVHNFGGCFR